jgi:hypothetical protein
MTLLTQFAMIFFGTLLAAGVVALGQAQASAVGRAHADPVAPSTVLLADSDAAPAPRARPPH